MPQRSLFEGLNPQQAEAVRHIDGPLLILAGPGSGKTRAVTHRIAHLIDQGVPAGSILALTFTNKAAAEMQRRVRDLVPSSRVWLGTFHRFGARMLRTHGEYVGLPANFTIYDTSDNRQTLKRVLESEQIATGGYTVDRIASAISDAKNRLITAQEYQPTTGKPITRVVAEAYPAYQKRLLDSGAVDFDDLLLHVAQMLRDNPQLRADLDQRFRYVLVDEYQDTNRAQYVILRALSIDYPNLAATGDPDQSIYGWRGADISNILEFERDYPQTKIVRLEQNYRSTARILQVADVLIAHNQRRKPKRLFTENGEGAPVRLAVYADQESEARDIARQIREAIESGARRASDFGIFYRINALSRTLERALRAERVPYQMVRGLEFYQRKEIKDVLGYCQLAANPRDDVAFERVVNSPARGLGRQTLHRLADFAYKSGVSLLESARSADRIGLTPRIAAKLKAFVEVMDAIESAINGPVEELLGFVLDRTGYRDALAKSEDEEDLNRLANIEELLTDARQFDEASTDLGDDDAEGGARDEVGGIEAYLERAWLVNDTDGWEADTDKVTLMTLHATKGLEFPVVYLVALEDGILPHERSSNDPVQLEEERRLAFVGITRAMHDLQLSYVQQRDFRGQRRFAIPSSFLMEMPREAMEQRREATGIELIDWDSAADGDTGDGAPWTDEGWPEIDVNEAPPKARSDSAPIGAVAARLVSASALAAEGGAPAEAEPRTPPDVFRQGMVVLHPEFGPGKIVALSGAGRARKATVRFAAAGERRFVLVHSPLRPAAGEA